MERLTKAEEPIMQIIWKLKRVFIKDIIAALPNPKPPYNTISSIVRGLENKGMLSHEAFGRTHRYYPIIDKSSYRQELFKSLIKNYFSDSYAELLSFMAKDDTISEKQEKEFNDLIKKYYGD